MLKLNGSGVVTVAGVPARVLGHEYAETLGIIDVFARKIARGFDGVGILDGAAYWLKSGTGEAHGVGLML